MQSILLVSQNPDNIQETILKFKEKYHISNFDFHVYADNQPLGINQVREVEKEIYKKPFQGNYRLIILARLDQASIEAQNALLKILEEPPLANLILVTCVNEQQILPTILSRCQILRPEKHSDGTQNKDFNQNTEMLAGLLQMNGPERLTLPFTLVKSREDANKLMENLINILEMNLYNDRLKLPKLKCSELLKKAQAAKRFLDLNVNFKLVIDVFLLGL